MKSFRQYNESVRDKMTPMSTEDITKKINGLNGYELKNYLTDLIFKNDKGLLSIVLKNVDMSRLSEYELYDLVELAIEMRNLETVNLLLNYKLHYRFLKKLYLKATEYGYTDIANHIRELIVVDESVRDKMTPKSEGDIKKSMSHMDPDKKIMKGIQENIPYLVQMGIDEGGDVNKKYTNDMTPLKSAIHHYNSGNKELFEIIEMLLKAGADVSKEDTYYKTSLEIAEWGKLHDVVKLIKKYNKINESIRDKMTPVSQEHIMDVVDSMGIGNDKYKDMVLRCIKVYGADNLTRINDHSFRYGFKRNGLSYILAGFNVSGKWEINLIVDNPMGISDSDTRVYHMIDSFEHIKRIVQLRETILGESVRDKMTPKSKEDLRKHIDTLVPGERLRKGIEFGVLSKEEARDIIMGMDKEIRMEYGRRYGLMTPRELHEIFIGLPLVDKIRIMHKSGYRYPTDKLIEEFSMLNHNDKVYVLNKGIDFGFLPVLKYSHWINNGTERQHKELFLKMVKSLRKFTAKRLERERGRYGVVNPFLNEGVRDKMTGKSQEEIDMIMKDRLPKMIDQIANDLMASGDYDKIGLEKVKRMLIKNKDYIIDRMAENYTVNQISAIFYMNKDGLIYESIRDKMTGKEEKAKEWRNSIMGITEEFQEHFSVRAVYIDAPHRMALYAFSKLTEDVIREWFKELGVKKYVIDDIGYIDLPEPTTIVTFREKRLFESIRSKMTAKSQDDINKVVISRMNKYPELGYFNPFNWGFVFNEKTSAPSDVFVFDAPDGRNWTIVLWGRLAKYPLTIRELIHTGKNNTEISTNSYAGIESVLRNNGYVEKVNEGIRDKMTPKSIEEVDQVLDRISEGDYDKFLRSTMSTLLGILSKGYPDEVYNRILQEIDFDLLRRNLGGIIADIVGMRYNLVKKYRAKVRGVRTYGDIADIAYEIGDEIGDVGYRDEILIRLIMLNPMEKTKAIIRRLIVGDVNESVRDKMKPKSEDDIKYSLEEKYVGRYFKSIWNITFVDRIIKIVGAMYNLHEWVLIGLDVKTGYEGAYSIKEIKNLFKEVFPKKDSRGRLIYYVNESVRTKMTPRSKDELDIVLKGYTPKDLFEKGEWDGDEWMMITAIDQGVDLRAYNMEYLKRIVRQNYIGVVEHLLKKGYDLNPVGDFDPFYIVACNGHNKMAQLLIKYGVRMNKRALTVAHNMDHQRTYTLLWDYYNKQEGVVSESIRDKMTGKGEKVKAWRNSIMGITEELQDDFGVRAVYIDAPHRMALYAFSRLAEDVIREWFEGLGVKRYVIDDIGYIDLPEPTTIVTFRERRLFESLRDKMTPRSKDDTKELLADIMRILSFKLYKWPSAKWSREEAHRYAESHRSFVEQWVADFGYTPDRLEALAGEMISYFGTKINESLRDKMTPKSSEDIKNILRNKTPNEIFQIGVRLGDSEIVRSAFERDRGINIVYPELTSIVVGNKLDIVKTILEYQPQAIYRIIKAVIENMNFSSPHALMDKHRTKLETYIMLSDIPEQEILDKSLIYLCHVDSGYGIRLLSYMGADIHQDNEEPLMQAIYNGRHHSVKTLLSLGADPTVDNNRPLEEARRRKYYDIADIISKHISSLPFRKRLSRYIPFLKESVRAKMTPISDENMRKKIKGMKLDRYRQFVEDEMGVIPRRRKNHIYVSVIEDRLKELRLPKEVADEIVNMTEEEQLRRMGYDIENMIPLGRFFTGIRYGFLDLVQQALDTGEVNVDCMNGGPLDNAVASGDEELVELLLKNGASVDKRDYQYTNERKHRNPKIKELLDRYAI